MKLRYNHSLIPLFHISSICLAPPSICNPGSHVRHPLQGLAQACSLLGVPLRHLTAAKQQLQVQLHPGTSLEREAVELILYRALIGLDWRQLMLKQPKGQLLEQQQQGLLGDKLEAGGKQGVHMSCCFCMRWGNA